jgi:DNA polymerase III epsilon subunit-like protein
MSFKPFTDNIIFYDAEFSSLDPYVGEILSIGLVTMEGREYYAEIEHEGEVSEWVKTHLLPTLTASKISRAEAQQQIENFVGDAKPYLLSYVNDFDVVYLRKLLDSGEMPFGFGPFNWLPLDMASILVGLGYAPEDFMEDDYTYLARQLGISTSEAHTHNALDDAKLLREVYVALVNQS